MGDAVDCKSKISIWWDIENCHVPDDVDPHYIAQNLSSALHQANLRGPIEINVFGDTKDLHYGTQKALSDTGITLNHVPRGNKDAADKAILVAMLLWALDNPPPAHFLLISGDGDFANALHRLRLKRYSILLARPDQFVKPALLGAAKSVWYWKTLAKGQLTEPETYQATERVQESSFLRNAGSNGSLTLTEKFQQRLGSIHSANVAVHTTPPVAVSTGLASLQKMCIAVQGKDAGVATTVSTISESPHLSSFNSQFQNLHLQSEEVRMEVNRVGNGNSSRSQSSDLSSYNGRDGPHVRRNSDSSISSSNSSAVVSSCPAPNTINPVMSMGFRHHPHSLPADKLYNEGRKQIMPNASMPNTIGFRPSSTASKNYCFPEGSMRKVPTQYAPPSIAPPNSTEVQSPVPKVPFQYAPPNIAGAQSPMPKVPMQYGPPSIALVPKLPAQCALPSIAGARLPVSKVLVQCAPLNIVETQSPVSRYDQREVVPRNHVVASSSHLLESHSMENLQNNSHDSGLGMVYSAMKTLEREMLAPTESNLLDCIQYWSQQQGSFDLKQILSKAVELHQVTKMQLGQGLIMYFPPNNKEPWKCEDPGNMQNEYPNDLWGELQRFLLYDGQRLSFLRSRSRYEAAQILKKGDYPRMSNLVTGKLINFLQQAIQQKKWLMRTGAVSPEPLSLDTFGMCKARMFFYLAHKSGQPKSGFVKDLQLANLECSRCKCEVMKKAQDGTVCHQVPAEGLHTGLRCLYTGLRLTVFGSRLTGVQSQETKRYSTWYEDMRYL